MKKTIKILGCVGVGICILFLLFTPRGRPSVAELKEQIPAAKEYVLANESHLDTLLALSNQLNNSVVIAPKHDPSSG